jgi:drug/metabolite transporter (DMT)-like permease
MSFGLGELFSLLSSLAWAVGVILYRRLGETLSPLALNFLKNSLVLGMLLPAVPLLHGLELPQFSAMELALAAASGFIGIALADTLYFRALNELGAGRIGVIGNLYSPFVILLSFAFLGERLSLLQGVGFILVSAGVLLVARPGRAASAVASQDTVTLVAAAGADAAAGHSVGLEHAAPIVRPTPRARGALLGVAAVLLMAVAIVMVKRVLESQPLLWVTLVRLVGAMLGLVLIAALTGKLKRLRPRDAHYDWRLLVLAAFTGQFLAMILWLAGYKYTQASIAAILNETASIFILLLAWLWLRDPLARRGALGVSLTLGGVELLLL